MSQLSTLERTMDSKVMLQRCSLSVFQGHWSSTAKPGLSSVFGGGPVAKLA